MDEEESTIVALLHDVAEDTEYEINIDGDVSMRRRHPGIFSDGVLN